MIDGISISHSLEEAQVDCRASHLLRQVKQQIIIALDLEHYDCGLYEILCSELGQRLPLTQTMRLPLLSWRTLSTFTCWSLIKTGSRATFWQACHFVL